MVWALLAASEATKASKQSQREDLTSDLISDLNYLQGGVVTDKLLLKFMIVNWTAEQQQ